MLGGSRQFISSGMGGAIPSSIPFNILDGYATRFGPHDPDDFKRFLTLIAVMDSELTSHHAKQMSKKAKK